MGQTCSTNDGLKTPRFAHGNNAFNMDPAPFQLLLESDEEEGSNYDSNEYLKISKNSINQSTNIDDIVAMLESIDDTEFDNENEETKSDINNNSNIAQPTTNLNAMPIPTHSKSHPQPLPPLPQSQALPPLPQVPIRQGFVPQAPPMFHHHPAQGSQTFSFGTEHLDRPRLGRKRRSVSDPSQIVNFLNYQKTNKTNKHKKDHKRSHSTLLKSPETKAWDLTELEETAEDMKKQLSLLEIENNLLDKLGNGTITTDEIEELDMIAYKFSLDVST